MKEYGNPIKPEGVGEPPRGYKVSTLSLTTVPKEEKKKIVTHYTF